MTLHFQKADNQFLLSFRKINLYIYRFTHFGFKHLFFLQTKIRNKTLTLIFFQITRKNDQCVTNYFHVLSNNNTSEVNLLVEKSKLYFEKVSYFYDFKSVITKFLVYINDKLSFQ